MLRSVNFFEREAVSLARFGFSYYLICGKLGISRNQLFRILRKHDLRLKDYRNGDSEEAKAILARWKKRVRKVS